MTLDETTRETGNEVSPTRVEGFLLAVGGKTSDAVHRRLLRACREPDAGPAMEAELSKIVTEILHEA